MKAKIRVRKSSLIDFTDVDAWVCFMPEDLKIEGDLNSAIIEAAGPELDEYIVDTFYKPKPGDVFHAPSFGAPVDHLFFAVIPEWEGGFNEEMHELSKCYRSCIQLAKDKGISDIAFPALGADKLKFPQSRAVRIALYAIIEEASSPLETVYIMCKDDKNYQAYVEKLKMLKEHRHW
ncbi:MAG: macro domain-containing protein [Micavibrio sp.]|nr:macro domain-containing protein [Micavibrio sp.]